MSLWGHNIEKIQVGTVYNFARVKVEDWPKNATHRHIQIVRDSVVIPRGELAEIFADVTYSDAILNGVLVGMEDLYLYKSCTTCKRRQSGDTCSPCGSPVLKNDYKVSRDFMYCFKAAIISPKSIRAWTNHLSFISCILSQHLPSLLE